MSDHSIFTKAVHAGEEPEKHHGAVSTPIYNATVFKFEDLESGAKIHNWEAEGYFYGRLGNPTQEALEKAMCVIEVGEDALCFASGMAAISAGVMSMVKSGEHIVAPEALYATTGYFFDFLRDDFGVEVTLVDAEDSESYRRAVKANTRLFYIETPSNPTVKITDMEAVVKIASEHGLQTICDNTFATPFNQNPLAFGCDAVVHSATKYLGGHSDISAGVMVGSRGVIDKARHLTSKLMGGSMAPEVAWLVLRGIKTLPLRMERHNENGRRVAAFLSEHPQVVRVHHPSLAGHPGHGVARRQMRDFGAMMSFDVGSHDAARTLLNSVKLCTLASSLGGIETIVQHSVSMTAAKVPREQRERAGITEGLIRLSVGIEDADDIIADLEQGLRKVAGSK